MTGVLAASAARLYQPCNRARLMEAEDDMEDTPESLLDYALELDATMQLLPPGDPTWLRTKRELDWALDAAAKAERHTMATAGVA